MGRNPKFRPRANTHLNFKIINQKLYWFLHSSFWISTICHTFLALEVPFTKEEVPSEKFQNATTIIYNKTSDDGTSNESEIFIPIQIFIEERQEGR